MTHDGRSEFDVCSLQMVTEFVKQGELLTPPRHRLGDNQRWWARSVPAGYGTAQLRVGRHELGNSEYGDICPVIQSSERVEGQFFERTTALLPRLTHSLDVVGSGIEWDAQASCP
jgi:hypothetical protein